MKNFRPTTGSIANRANRQLIRALTDWTANRPNRQAVRPPPTQKKKKLPHHHPAAHQFVRNVILRKGTEKGKRHLNFAVRSIRPKCLPHRYPAARQFRPRELMGKCIRELMGKCLIDFHCVLQIKRQAHVASHPYSEKSRTSHPCSEKSRIRVLKRHPTNCCKKKTPEKHPTHQLLHLPNGSGGWIRTSDQLINSQLRYHCATPEHGGENE